jgi:capsular polysaccharide biosynthesis protein
MEKTFTINDIIAIFMRRLWLIVAMALLGGVISFAYSQYVVPKKYTSSVTLYVYNQSNLQAQNLTANDFIFSAKLVETYLVILKSNQVLDAVSSRIKLLGLDYTASQIRTMIKAAAVSETEVFEVSVSSENKEHAKIIADTIGIVAPPEIIRVVKAGSVEIVDKAVVPQTHSTPNVTQNTIIGIILGIALAAGLAFLLELMNTSIKSKEDLIETYKLPVLTVIPSLHNDGASGNKYGYSRYGSHNGYGSNNGGSNETTK